jgi:glutaredoxin
MQKTKKHLFIIITIVISIAWITLAFPIDVMGKESAAFTAFSSEQMGAAAAPSGQYISATTCSSCGDDDAGLSLRLTALAQQITPTSDPIVPIYFFWGDGCPHCATAKPFLERLDQASDRVVLHSFEVWFVPENQDLFTRMTAAQGFEPHGVPTIFIGDKYWEGYVDQLQPEIQAVVERCLASNCPDPGAGIIPGASVATAASSTAVPTLEVTSALEQEMPASEQVVESEAAPEKKEIIVPLLGAIDLSSQSLFVSTLLISFVDGFNPCSIWVLTMLLALTLHTGSRKRVLIIGIIFLTVTAAIYGLFIAGLFTIFKVIAFVGWIQVVVALAALFFAVVNIKDYFWYKEGLSFTIADDKKPGIFQRVRRLMDSGQSMWALIGGTIVMAAGVSLVEFSCTAGFPVLWTNLLVSQNVSTLGFLLLLFTYLLIYQLDELGIFLVAVSSMRASKMEEKHGRILKLIGGMLMLALAGVMLVNPNLMNDLSSSLIVFGIAFGATLIVLVLHRLLLPRLGITIGSEFADRTSRKGRRLK